MMENWSNTSLENLFSFVIGGDWGKDLNYDDPDFTEVYCIRGSEIRNWNREKGRTAVLRKVAESSLEKRKLREGDILVEISGGGPEQPVGRTVFIDKDCLAFEPTIPKVCTNFLRLVRLTDAIDKKYVNYYLTFFYKTGEVVNYQGGSNNLRNLKFSEYSKINIPLAPLPEQKRIVAKLDKLFAYLDQLKTRLDKVPGLIKQFRQAVLSQAVTGKLTVEWKNHDCVWDTKTLETCADVIDPNPKHRNPIYTPNGFMFLSTAQFRDPDGWDLTTAKTVSEETVIEQEKRCNFKKDSIAFSRKGTIGKTRVLPINFRFALLDSVCVINPKIIVDPKYLHFAIQSELIQRQIRALTRGVALKQVSLGAVRSLQIPIPDLDEQKEIVRRIEFLFEITDRIESSCETLQEKIDQLPQSVLSRVFRGD